MAEGQTREDVHLVLHPLQTTSRVLTIISDRTGFTSEDILGYSQDRQLSKARHVACAVLHELGFSYPECARYLKRQSHRTAWNSVMVVGQSQELSKDVRGIVEMIRRENGVAE